MKYGLFVIAHGTFVGSIRVDPHKPVQVLVDSTLAFGASTRRFTLRERPNAHLMNLDSKQEKDDADAGTHSLLGLPEEDTELEVRTFTDDWKCGQHSSVHNEHADYSY